MATHPALQPRVWLAEFAIVGQRKTKHVRFHVAATAAAVKPK